MNNNPIAEIKTQCNGRWDSVIKDLTGFDGKPTHCPLHGGDSGKAFYGKRNEYAQSGKSFCNSCGCNSDGINTIAFITQGTVSDVVKRIMEYLNGYQVSEVDQAKLEQQQKIEAKKRFIREKKRFSKAMQDIINLINESEWIGDGINYFEQRGINRLANCYYRDIRFVKGAEHYDEGNTLQNDAIICLMRNSEGKVRNIQRIFLDESHKYKAKCESPKKMMPTPKENWHMGSAVRLAAKFNQMEGTEHVCEGVETGLSILSQTDTFTNMNCCLTAGNLSQFDIPKETKRLVIWADNDESTDLQGKPINVGVQNANKLKDKAEELGIEVHIIAPPMVGDWNDFPDLCKLMWSHLIESNTTAA
tara:strand:- start:6003 stop:7085 length:1083 start_codon:yes stop_codon:yes gene_type:complete